jgi:Interleukin-like EMT inducer
MHAHSFYFHNSLIYEDCQIETLAWGYDDAVGYHKATGYISINKVTWMYSKEEGSLTRGFNTVELILSNCSAGVIRHFDTWSSVSNSDALATYISGLPSWTILIGITADDATTSLTLAARTALHSIGVDVTQLKFRGKLSFVAQVGRPSGTVMRLKPDGGDALKLDTTVSRK